MMMTDGEFGNLSAEIGVPFGQRVIMCELLSCPLYRVGVERLKVLNFGFQQV